mgnify:FL=1
MNINKYCYVYELTILGCVVRRLWQISVDCLSGIDSITGHMVEFTITFQACVTPVKKIVLILIGLVI